jgi:hypothetical protein
MDVVLDINQKIGVEVNPSNVMSYCQKAGQNHIIKIGNKLLETVAKFEYVGMTVANNNCILHSGNACYIYFQKLMPSDLLL